MRQNHKPCDSRNAVLLCLTFVSHKAQQWLFSRQRIMCLQWLDIHVSTSNPVPPFMIQRCSRLHILRTQPQPQIGCRAPGTDGYGKVSIFVDHEQDANGRNVTIWYTAKPLLLNMLILSASFVSMALIVQDYIGWCWFKPMVNYRTEGDPVCRPDW